MAHIVAGIKEWGFAYGMVVVGIVALIIYLIPDFIKKGR